MSEKQAENQSKVTPFMREKWARVFDMEDFRGVGKVEEQDFIEWGRRATVNAGIEYAPELKQHWVNAHKAYYGKNVTKEAWVKNFGEFAERDDAFDTIRELNKLLMLCVDTNSDGVVSWKEFYAGLSPIGVSEEGAKFAFECCDTDGNGVIDLDEWSTASAHYYFDKEMSKHANFFGPYVSSGHKV
eukprot:CAMPEP_0172503778 /NCGR_PEP_ID=MMETSP1066-20121228/172230_1 /TAXON_ID=671091 /ORGANISM="Coscinodiscus wailesii, Strain CCMP2513" /LENGTH=185 /DNA_ID=CAMNT_0013279657 /DNA_START=144 /DNA_END=701 /DNA_ORIENTATION=-